MLWRPCPCTWSCSCYVVLGLCLLNWELRPKFLKVLAVKLSCSIVFFSLHQMLNLVSWPEDWCLSMSSSMSAANCCKRNIRSLTVSKKERGACFLFLQKKYLGKIQWEFFFSAFQRYCLYEEKDPAYFRYLYRSSEFKKTTFELKNQVTCYLICCKPIGCS